MGKELYVGRLPYEATEYELERLFSVSGRVTSIHLITDPATGEFKGCGYVRMSTEAEAKDAIASLDGALLGGKTITVSEARPQKQQQAGGYKGKGGPRAGGFGKGAAGRAVAAKAGPSRGGAPKPGGSRPAAGKAGDKPGAARTAGKATSGTGGTGSSRGGKR